MEIFPHLIGVLLFNKPDDAHQTLSSFLDQTVKIDPTRLIISIDGFAGSKDEHCGRTNNTHVVAQIAQEVFPNATVVQHSSNLGIAKHYDYLERLLFKLPESEWVYFQEDDFVLGRAYLEVVADIISQVNDTPEVAVVSATGDSMMSGTNAIKGLVPMHHHWSYALRKSHFEERISCIDYYLQAIDELPYFKRDLQLVLTKLAESSIFPIGSSQDFVKQALQRDFGRLALTTQVKYGKYIGNTGEHFTEELFDSLGYNEVEVSDTYSKFQLDWNSEDVQSMLTKSMAVFQRELAEERLSELKSHAEYRAATEKIISEQEQLLQSKDHHLKATEKIISEQEQLLQSKDHHLKATEKIISEQEQLLQSKDHHLKATEKIISEQEQLLQSAKELLDELQHELKLEQHLNMEITNSASWRFTAPLRYSGRKFARLRTFFEK